jgi:DNA-binding SARP family transcriptional activator/ATP/maltotriose-dependent transcriptional regulator MalT
MKPPPGPPAPPPYLVPQPRLAALVEDLLKRPLTLLVAGPGFGKTTLAATAIRGRRCAWLALEGGEPALPLLVRRAVDVLAPHLPGLPRDLIAVTAAVRDHVTATAAPEADESDRAASIAGALCAEIGERLDTELVLVVDGVPELVPGGPVAAFLEALCRQAPPGLHLLLTARAELPFPLSRMLSAGLAGTLTTQHLAFTAEEAQSVVEAALPGSSLGGVLHEVTAGWPAALHLAVEHLRPLTPEQRVAAAERLRQPDGPLLSYLAEEVFSGGCELVKESVRRIAVLGEVSAELGAAIGITDAPAIIDWLAQRGLLTPAHRPGRWQVSRLAADYAAAHLPLPASERSNLLVTAATFHLESERPSAALQCLKRAGALPELAAQLRRHGPSVVARGHVQLAVECAELLPPELRCAEIDQVEGQARQVLGDWLGALRCFQRAAGDADRLAPGLAWRMGLIHHHRGDFDAALDVYARGEVGVGADADEALLDSWHATARWMRRDLDGARTLASRGMAAAERCGEPAALAAAHAAYGLLAKADGDTLARESHYRSALVAAERAGDVLQIIRIRNNRGSRRNDEGRYAEALVELDAGLRLAHLAGFTAKQALLLVNRGEAYMMLGRLDEALGDFETARQLYTAGGSLLVCYALTGAGAVHRLRGEATRARTLLEEAVVLATKAGDGQALVLSRAELAMALVQDEPEAAAELARDALIEACGWGELPALLALGWATLAMGDVAAVREYAATIGRLARSQGEPAALAEQAELLAATEQDPHRRQALLDEAAERWGALGCVLREARAVLLASPVPRPEVTNQLRALGMRAEVVTWGWQRVPLCEVSPPAPVEIRVLGNLDVLRSGQPVPVQEWQSKKARELLAILVARRGRPVAREVLMGLLWPREEPEKLGNRLSVALSTARAVLDPDRAHPADHYVSSRSGSLALQVREVRIDVEQLLRRTAVGLDLLRAGQPADARAKLERATALYVGDFYEDDPYAEWAHPMRDEARESYLAATRGLVTAALSCGDSAAAIRYALRLLEQDQYDEPAHLDLVRALLAAGRHGEARRRYQRYVELIRELGVEPAALPQHERARALPAVSRR